MNNSKQSDRPLPTASLPHGICVDCRGLKACSKCHNDAFCTTCAKNPDRVAGSAVKYIVRTPSFEEAQEQSNFEPCNQSIVAEEGRIPVSKKVKENSINLMRSSLVKICCFHTSNYRVEDFYSSPKNTSLGKGSYGTVSKVRCVYSDVTRALKTVIKSKIENITRLKREILIMKRIDHPGIIRLHEVFEDENNLYLIMELCTGGELFDRVIRAQRFSEQYTSKLAKQIFSVVSYIHSNDIIHRDLKPENLLYIDSTPSSRIKVIDWGFALRCSSNHKLTSVVGTPYYVAPEILHGSYGHECDLWSAGIIMFIMLCGYPPFYGQDNKEILKKVKQGNYSFEQKHWGTRSSAIKNLISRLLCLNPAERITAKEALNHEWIQFFDKVRHNDKHELTFKTDKLSLRLAGEIFTRFQNFTRMHPIKMIAVTATAYMLGGRDLGHSTVIFNALDKNCDGVLSTTELKEAFAGLNVSNEELDYVFSLIDTDGNGTIDYTEFLASTMDSSLYSSDKLARVAFRVFDSMCKNEVTADELMRVCIVNTGKGSFTRENIARLISPFTDNRGIMTFESFRNLLLDNEGRGSHPPGDRDEDKERALPPSKLTTTSPHVHQPVDAHPRPTTALSVTSGRKVSEPVVVAFAPQHNVGDALGTVNPNQNNKTRKASPLMTTYNKARTLLKRQPKNQATTTGGTLHRSDPPSV